MNPLIIDLIKAVEVRVIAESHLEASRAAGLDENAYATKVVNLRALEHQCALEIDNYIKDLTRLETEGGD